MHHNLRRCLHLHFLHSIRLRRSFAVRCWCRQRFVQSELADSFVRFREKPDKTRWRRLNRPLSTSWCDVRRWFDVASQAVIRSTPTPNSSTQSKHGDWHRGRSPQRESPWAVDTGTWQTSTWNSNQLDTLSHPLANHFHCLRHHHYSSPLRWHSHSTIRNSEQQQRIPSLWYLLPSRKHPVCVGSGVGSERKIETIKFRFQ